jgi:hypothetical protein
MNVEELTREDAIYYARLSEQGERYQDMIMYMKKVAKVSNIIKMFCVFLILSKTKLNLPSIREI